MGKNILLIFQNYLQQKNLDDNSFNELNEIVSTKTLLFSITMFKKLIQKKENLYIFNY